MAAGNGKQRTKKQVNKPVKNIAKKPVKKATKKPVKIKLDTASTVNKRKRTEDVASTINKRKRDELGRFA